MHGKKLIITIPCFNEERTLPLVIRSIPRQIPGIAKIETLVIDDGSTDRSAVLARKAGAQVISHHKNEGLGVAFRTGINASLERKANVIVNIDADGQFNPGDIPRLIIPILRHQAAMVTATRFKDRRLTPANMPRLKRIGNAGLIKLMNFLTSGQFTDTQCGFRAYSREAALRLNTFGQFTYTQEVFIDLVNKDLTILEIPVKVKYFKTRKAKVSYSLFNYGLNALIIILRTFRDYRPLVFFGLPGLAVFGLGFLLTAPSAVYWLIFKQTSPVRMLLFTGGFFIVFGFLLLLLALVADMLKRIRRNQEEILYGLKSRSLKL